MQEEVFGFRSCLSNIWQGAKENKPAKWGTNKITKKIKCPGENTIIQDKFIEDWFWSKDTEGHSDCAWKIYKDIGNNQFIVDACADKNETIIRAKHESGSNKVITCK